MDDGARPLPRSRGVTDRPREAMAAIAVLRDGDGTPAFVESVSEEERMRERAFSYSPGGKAHALIQMFSEVT